MSAFPAVDTVLLDLTALEQRFRANRDRRALFATAYRTMTTKILHGLETGIFEDSEWASGYTAAFAKLYFNALADFDAGRRDRVPKAWIISFETAVANSVLAVQDLTLGVNAHINHDLAYALRGVSIEPREKRYRDHTIVNEILKSATDAVQSAIAQAYAPALAVMEELAGPVDEKLVNFSLVKARENAWVQAVALADAPDAAHRKRVEDNIEAQSAVMANLVVLATAKFPYLIPVLQRLEAKRLTLVG